MSPKTEIDRADMERSVMAHTAALKSWHLKLETAEKVFELEMKGGPVETITIQSLRVILLSLNPGKYATRIAAGEDSVGAEGALRDFASSALAFESEEIASGGLSSGSLSGAFSRLLADVRGLQTELQQRGCFPCIQQQGRWLEHVDNTRKALVLAGLDGKAACEMFPTQNARTTANIVSKLKKFATENGVEHPKPGSVHWTGGSIL